MTKPAQLPDGRVLVLRTCAEDMTSYGGFKWKKRGVVTAPDWNKRAECGHGLHGLLSGVGEGGLLDWSPEANWLVVAVDPKTIVELNGKVKFPEGQVVYAGSREGAIARLDKHGAAELPVVAAVRSAGDSGTATAGDRGTATAGDSGTATAGDRGTATAGDRGTATAGDRGTATAGDSGTATAGDRGTATAGDGGTATAGECGVLSIVFYAATKRLYAPRIAVVGDDGIQPNVAYRLDGNGKFVQAKP